MIGTDTYLGPAVVTHVTDPLHLNAVLGDGSEVCVRWAMPLRYDAAEGDELLVIGTDASEMFGIGVLRGKGTAVLSVPGDLELRSEEGAVRISGARGARLESAREVAVTAPLVRLSAGKVEILARRIVEKARDAYFWVTDLLQWKSHRMRAVTETTYHLKARQVNLRADEDANIDGQSVNLG